jgi:hypothetical protein
MFVPIRKLCRLSGPVLDRRHGSNEFITSAGNGRDEPVLAVFFAKLPPDG